MLKTSWSHFIGGEFVAASSGEMLVELDPRNGRSTLTIARGNSEDVLRAVGYAVESQPGWWGRPSLHRGRVMLTVAQEIRRNTDLLAKVDQIETGRPLPQVIADIEMCAQYFEFYGGIAPVIEGETIDLGEEKLCYTVREPYGVVGIILPWNGPLTQASRAMAPALAAGNTVVAKPSEFTSVSTLMLAEICTYAGMPAGVVNVVTGTGTEVGAEIVAHPDIAKVAFTGSLRAGQEIGVQAARRIAPVTLELGGKSPDLVFADADLDRAAAGAVKGFTINAGQACIAGTRILVEASVKDVFIDKLSAEVRKLKVGSESDCQIGPMITRKQFDRVCEFFEIARCDGARLIVGGKPLSGDGFFVEPTVYADVPRESPVLQEEIFGPVCAVMDFRNEDEAVRMANDTNFGLAAGIWTQNFSRAHRVARKLKAGQIYINQYPLGGIETPFGGFKQSGIGREKGREALHHYTQVKTIMAQLE